MPNNNCLFCKIIAGEIPGKMIYQDEWIVALQDVAPQAPHHYLLIPRKHLATTLDIAEEDQLLVGHIFRVAAQLAAEMGFADEGFRVVNNCNRGAGQTVWHLHFHLLGGRNLTWPPG